MHGLIAELHAAADEFISNAMADVFDRQAIGLWKEAISAAFSLAKADRARELRGDRTVPRFNAEGLHPFSAEWGRVMALEAIVPGLSDVREKLQADDHGEAHELFVNTRVVRLEAREAAEYEHARELRVQEAGRLRELGFPNAADALLARWPDKTTTPEEPHA